MLNIVTKTISSVGILLRQTLCKKTDINVSQHEINVLPYPKTVLQGLSPGMVPEGAYHSFVGSSRPGMALDLSVLYVMPTCSSFCSAIC